MSKENILLIISVFLSITILVFSSYIFFSSKQKGIQDHTQQNQKNMATSDTEENSTQEIQKEIPSQQASFVYSAWIPAFDFNNGYQSLKMYKDLIKEVNPVIYGVNSDGSLLNRKPEEQILKDFLEFCSLNNIKVVPTVGSYDYEIMEDVFSSEVYVKKHINEIMNEVQKYNYSGIDIDYERIKNTNKDGYILFLKNLKTELEKSNKSLSVTVFAKTRDYSTDTLFVQDWEEIAKFADKVKIMAYDYTLQTSPTPGPIGPLYWITDVINYSKEKIPPEKVSLGIHLYSYLWKGDKASALTYSSVLDIINTQGIQKEYKSDLGEGYAQYTCSDGSKCVLYYQTPQGVNARIQIAKENNLSGVSYWRLGRDSNILSSEL